MSSELIGAVAAAAGRLLELCQQDTALRGHLRAIAQALLEATESLPASQGAGPAAQGVGAPLPPPRVEPPPQPPEVLPPLTLGSAPSPAIELPPSFQGRISTATADGDLPAIEARCRLKAEGARWAAARQRLLAEGAVYASDIEPSDRDIIARAKALDDCFLWMNGPRAPIPADLGLWEDVAGCFDAVADAVAVIRAILSDESLGRGFLEKALDLLAEAQSALRSAVGMVDGPTDSDQAKVFSFLKAITAEEQIFIQRYMRADDPADPDNWSDIAARIATLDSQIQAARKQQKSRAGRMNKLRYHLKAINTGRGNSHDWEVVIETVGEMVEEGLPPSNIELRDLLLPVLDSLPESAEPPAAFQRVLQEIDRYLAARPSQPDARPAAETSPDVQGVARMLAGRSVLLIGGLRRPAAKEALERAFGLKELIWFETREHESVDIFEP